jgi:hypothetical protein
MKYQWIFSLLLKQLKEVLLERQGGMKFQAGRTGKGRACVGTPDDSRWLDLLRAVILVPHLLQ